VVPLSLPPDQVERIATSLCSLGVPYPLADYLSKLFGNDADEPVISVKDFGASAAASAAANTTAIQAALDTGLPVWFEPGVTYAFNGGLTINTDDQIIYGNGATLDGSAIAAATVPEQVHGLAIRGSIALTGTLSSSLVAGAVVVNASTTAGVSAGGLVLVLSGQPYPINTNADETRAEIHRVKSVASGTQLILSDGLFLNYNHTIGGELWRLAPVRGVQVNDLKVRMGGVGKAHIGFRADYTENCWWNKCEADGCEDAGLRWTYSYLGGADGGRYLNATSPFAGGGPVTSVSGYGLAPGTATREITIKNTFISGCRHGVAGGGSRPSIACRVLDNHVEGGSNGEPSSLDCHEDCLLWEFNENVITGTNDITNSGGGTILNRGQMTSIIGNTITGSRSMGILSHIYDIDPDGMVGVNILNNTVLGARLQGIYIQGETATALVYRANIQGNTVRGCGDDGILLSRTIHGTVNGNTVADCGGNGIRLSGTSSSERCQHIIISDNVATGNTLRGIRADFSDACVIGNNISISNTGGADLFGVENTNLLRTRYQSVVTTRAPTLTIVSGVITITEEVGYVALDTEAAAATDDLTTINGGSDGQILVLRSLSSSRDPTIKHNLGNIRLAAGADFALASVLYRMVLMYDSSTPGWVELSRAAVT